MKSFFIIFRLNDIFMGKSIHVMMEPREIEDNVRSVVGVLVIVFSSFKLIKGW